MTTPSSRVIIVGAGVFGLSTALHLAEAGYKNVTVFDYQPYDQTIYDPEQGCDSASSDINKIYRCSYGTEVEYQDSAFSGRPIWVRWNEAIAKSRPQDSPRGITPQTKVFEPNGSSRVSEGKMSQYDIDSMKALEQAGIRHFQHLTSDTADMARLAKSDGPATRWKTKLEAFEGVTDGSSTGYLDTSAGLTYADKACVWARHLCVKAGVRFILGPEKGKLQQLVIEHTPSGRRVTGITTVDGRRHAADVVIMACGPWTPSLVSETGPILQATAGSVCQIKSPKSRPDLWDKYSPENFPVWAYGLTGHESPEYGGFYGFPRSKNGVIKIGYRGRKWINSQPGSNGSSDISTPITKYTPVKATNLPKKAIDNLKKAVDRLFPDLKDVGITGTRMCWYTDSLDNSFVIDYVPEYSDSLFIATGGSGHGFKFLPVSGKHVRNASEKKEDQFTKLWRWRLPSKARVDDRQQLDLSSSQMATEEDWQWTKTAKAIVDRVDMGRERARL